MYYSCPHRDEKESRGVVPDKNWEPPNKVCEICGTEHVGTLYSGTKTKPPDTSNVSYEANPRMVKWQ